MRIFPLLLAVLTCFGSGLHADVVTAGCRQSAGLRKLGTVDSFIVEANPVVFKGKAYLFEYIRWLNDRLHYRGNDTGRSYFRFRALDDMKTVTPAFGQGLHLGNAFVWKDRVYVTATECWGGSRVMMLESDDLVHWSTPRPILSGAGWRCYNTTLCRADGRFVLSFEMDAPKEEVGEPYTMFFAESADLKSWKRIDGAAMGRDRYTGAPMLRYFAGWFYFFHLEADGHGGYVTRVARSRDLKDWTFSPKPVLAYGPEDKAIHPLASFTPAECAEIAAAKNVNASDLDMCEVGGRLVACYSWGDQNGHEYFALAEAPCTEREFCESFFGPDRVSGADVTFDETNAEISVNPHVEHRGASVRLAKEDAVWRVHYDFSGGGHGVGLKVRPRTPFSADRICFEARHGQGHKMAVLIEDSAGQFFFRYAEPQPFRWCSFECDLAARWPIHWGGANDGVVRQPIVSFEVSIDRTTKGTPVADDVGDVLVRNIAARTVRPTPEMAGSSVRYLVSDFTSGDRFSGAPRRFYRDDTPWIAVTNGELEVDFASRDGMSLIHEIPVWGCPERLHLAVEAPVEAAGLSFAVGYRAGGDEKTLELGRLPSAEANAASIRHELSVSVPASAAKSRRVMRVTVRRGTAPAKRLKVRLLKLEASVRPGVDLPPLLATPPTGAEPPRELEVAYLNLGPQTTEGCSVVVRTTDWQGRKLGLSVTPLPPVRPGARAIVRARVPSVADGLNFASYSCLLVRGAERVDETPGWTTSWTRPLADAGDTEKRPDLPWGFCLCLDRTEDPMCYASGYAILTNEAALVVLEKKAALAQAMGVKWERAGFQPQRICSEKGAFDFSFCDRLVDCAERHGISLYVCFSHYWPMRGKKRFDQHDRTAYTPENYTNWVETLRVSVERYRGRVAGWEIWNEPNWTFWNGPKEDYARLVSMSYPAVKAADPAARVLACSTCGIDLDFIDRCIRDGARFDDITIHPYKSDPDERGFMAELAAVTNRSHGTKTWLTELGWPTGCDAKTYSERQQAAYLARAYLAAAGSGCCAAINGYDFFDDGFNVLERENNFGIVRRDGTPKPAYRALAKVFRFFTRGQPSIAHQRMSDGTQVWIFRMGGRSAVWSDVERPLRVTTANGAVVRNLMDETIGPGSGTVVFTGPLDVVLFDGDVRTVEELPQDVRGEEKVGRCVF